MAKPTKYVFVTGGVLSGLGKGITAASIGNILKARGLRVNAQKLDPYLNVDAGTLNPAEHGECFVTKDGAETDLDLGHYERFLDIELTNKSSVMSGRIISQLISDERAGKFLGKTVQVVPHLTNAIQQVVLDAAKGFDVHIVEIGGTVGDYESPAFFEAIRELGAKVGSENSLFVHVVYLPYLSTSKEIKTKPAQNAVRDLRSLGIMPDVLVARSEVPSSSNPKKKLSAFCGVPEAGIAVLPNARTVYEVPLTLEKQGIGNYIMKHFDLRVKNSKNTEWEQMVKTILAPAKHKLKIGVVAKYLDNQDTYMSVFEALKAAAWSNSAELDITWVDSEKLEQMDDISQKLDNLDGIVVPGGFGTRGLEGKIAAAQYALTHKKPYLGLCLGLQMGMIAAARNAGVKEATTFELEPDAKKLIITTMSDQRELLGTGGTMRLGDYACILEKGSLASHVYGGKYRITERHRHRGECNPKYRNNYEKWGIRASGINPDNGLVEVIEAIDHPFFLASQFHPEFKSRPNRPHPMFSGFIESLLAKKKPVK